MSIGSDGDEREANSSEPSIVVRLPQSRLLHAHWLRASLTQISHRIQETLTKLELTKRTCVQELDRSMKGLFSTTEKGGLEQMEEDAML